MTYKVGDQVRLITDHSTWGKVTHVFPAGSSAGPGTWSQDWVLFDTKGNDRPLHYYPARDVEMIERATGAIVDSKDIPFERRVHRLFGEAADLLLSKHHDYGPKNISESPGGALNGLRVRLYDKLARLNHLVESGADPEHESLEDTFRDILGYGAIGVLVLRGDWPNG